MSLSKRGSVWWSTVWIDGIRYRKSTGTGNRRQAETIDRNHHDELNAARHRLPRAMPAMTFGALAARFIGSDAAKPHALDRLKHVLPFFADYLLPDIDAAAIRRYREARYREKNALTAATVNRDLSVLRRVLNWGVEEGCLAMNPLGRLHLERERRTKRTILSVREERLLLAAAPEHLRRIIVCALDTGMRRGEILRQTWEDIDFDHRILYVTHSKTPEGESRVVPLTGRLHDLLASCKRTRGIVFTYAPPRKANADAQGGIDGESVNPAPGNPIKIVKTTWASSLRRAAIRHVRLHDLRHTANTRLMLAGVPQEIRREILGHSSHSRDTNDRYTHVDLPAKQDAIRKLEAWYAREAAALDEEAPHAAATPTNQPTPKEITHDGPHTHPH